MRSGRRVQVAALALACVLTGCWGATFDGPTPMPATPTTSPTRVASSPSPASSRSPTSRPTTLVPTSLEFAQLRSQFDFDSSSPLDTQEAGTALLGGVTRHDISYASPYDGSRVPAYLFEPAESSSPEQLPGLILM